MFDLRTSLTVIFWMGFSQNLFATTKPDSIIDKLNEIDANVVLMRHALAPGFGDPKNFVINQCATQRNLDDKGRNQAKLLGLKLKQKGLVFNKIYSSYWCRCLETAQIMNLGVVTSFAGLNSFFQSHADRNQTLQLLEEKLEGLDQNSLTLMVTHQVVIQAVTGMSVSSGDFVAYNSRIGKSVRINIK
jgi:phosphohistidine phosphatase SixA